MNNTLSVSDLKIHWFWKGVLHYFLFWIEPIIPDLKAALLENPKKEEVMRPALCAGDADDLICHSS